MKRETSYRTKLISFILLSTLVVSLVGLYSATSSRMLLQETQVLLISSQELTNISEEINQIHTDFTAYLFTRSSDSLQKFYGHNNAISSSISDLRSGADYSGRGAKIKNLSYMVDHYLGVLDTTVIAKRNENVADYVSGYDAANREYAYVKDYIQGIMSNDLSDSATKYADLQRSIATTTTLNYIMLVITITLIVIGSILFSYEVTKPVSQLAGYAKAVSEGHFEVELEVDRSSREMHILFQTFKMMLESIRTHVSQLREKQQLEQQLADEQIKSLKMDTALHEAELLALQYQANPHFIFNTINIGSRIALLQGDKVTCNYLESAADVFRYNLKGLGYNATLREEVDNVTAYMNLLTTRFGDNLTFLLDVPEDLMNEHFLMPRMTLQPLVENAFIHGVSKSENGGSIEVTASRNDNFVVITVSNTGEAIPPAQIEALLADTVEIREPIRKGHTTGIGINNMLRRLRLFYNVTDVMRIICGGGKTTFILKLPCPIETRSTEKAAEDDDVQDFDR